MFPVPKAAGLALLAALAPCAAPPDLDVPADHPAVEILRRSQARSGDLFPMQAFPQSSRALSSSGPLSAYDALYLEQWSPWGRRAAVRWEDSALGRSFFLSPLAEADYAFTETDSSDRSGVGGVGLTVYGQVAPHVVYYTHGMVYTEKTNRAQFGHQYDPNYGETSTVEKGANDTLLKDRTYNRFESYAIVDFSWIKVKFGRDRLRMGPGYFSSMLAGKDTPPYNLMEGRIDFASWLKLDNYLIRMTDTDHGIQKYANIHRFEFRPTRHLEAGFQDIVIYQDRDPDPVYILPLAPLTFSEANNGGRDNAAMGFDFLYSGIPNLSVWSELFIDDLLGPTTFFNDFWENRWAYLAGFQYALPLSWADADLVAEISQVEPWTYNGRQSQTSFKHFDRPSASKLGPDSRSYDVQLAYRPSRWAEIRERFEYNEKGMGRGATLGVIHVDAIDGTSKSLLSDSIHTQTVFRHEARFSLTRYAQIHFFWFQNLGFEAADRFGFRASAVW
jgi:hypothetical protein